MAERINRQYRFNKRRLLQQLEDATANNDQFTKAVLAARLQNLIDELNEEAAELQAAAEKYVEPKESDGPTRKFRGLPWLDQKEPERVISFSD